MTADLDPMLPVPYRVVERRDRDRRLGDPAARAGRRVARRPFARAVHDALRPRRRRDRDLDQRRPGRVDGALTQTIRDVGAVSRALHDAAPGTIVGVRGPFGDGWDLDTAVGQDW